MALDTLLAAATDELELPLSPQQSAQLLELTGLVDQWARRINLTGHRGPEAILSGLVIEGLALRRVLPEWECLLDLGSGAGFPGLPLAIARPTSRVTLLDAREKRHHFQRAAIRALDLENVSPLLGRAEALDPEPHDLVISQALAQPELAVPLMRRWAAPGAKLALAVSSPPDLPAPLRRQLGTVETIPYRVPISGRERVLWTAEVSSRS